MSVLFQISILSKIADPNFPKKFRLLAPFLTETTKALLGKHYEELYQKDTKNPQYLYLMGLIYEYGLGVPKDSNQAADHYLNSKSGQALDQMASMINQKKYILTLKKQQELDIDLGLNPEHQAMFFTRGAMSWKNGHSICQVGDLILKTGYQPTDDNFVAIASLPFKGTRYNLAIAFYRHAMDQDDMDSYFRVAQLFEKDLCQPIRRDYLKMGIKEGDKAMLIMALYHKAMALGNGAAFNAQGVKIEQGRHKSDEADFNIAQILVNDSMNQYQKAAAFYLRGMSLGDVDSFLNFANLVKRGHYTPTKNDFETAGIDFDFKKPANQYQYAAAIYRPLLKRPNASTLELARMIMSGYDPTDADYLAAGIPRLDDNNPTDGDAASLSATTQPEKSPLAKAADFICCAMQLNVPGSFYSFAQLINERNYQPTRANFDSVGLKYTDKRYEQIATFLRKGMMSGDHNCFIAMSQLVLKGKYLPTTDDFQAANLEPVKGTPSHKAVAFLRPLLSLKDDQAFYMLGTLIKNRAYVPCHADFEAARFPIIENHYDQVRMFLRQAYLSNPNLRDQVFNLLQEHEKDDVDGLTRSTLCYIYLVDEKNLKEAKSVFNDLPNKNKTLKEFMATLINQLKTPPDITRLEMLENFVRAKGGKKLFPLQFNYLKLKKYLIQGETEKALDYYNRAIPSYHPLTSLEYKLLANATLNKSEAVSNAEDKAKLKSQAIELLHASSITLDSDAKKAHAQPQALITIAAEKAEIQNIVAKTLQIAPDDPANTTIKALIKEKGEFIITTNKNTLADLESFRTQRFKKFDTMSLSYLASYFFKRITAKNHPELMLIDKILDNVKHGKPLAEQLKDPELQSNLKKFVTLSRKLEELTSSKPIESTQSLDANGSGPAITM